MRAWALQSKVTRYLLAILCIITLNFFLIHSMPGDPLIHLLGEDTYGHLRARNPGQLEELREKFGLGGSTLTQYLEYIGNLAKGDLGWSYQYNRPVLHVILHRLKWTLLLLLPALCISSLFGSLLGSLSGMHRGGRSDRLLTPLFLALYSVPVYCLAFLFLLLFAVYTDVVPLQGMTDASWADGKGIWSLFRHAVLPLSVVTLHATAYHYMIMRNSVHMVCAEGFVSNLKARGFSDRYILFRHVLINASLPFITAFALQFGSIFSGALLVEVVFSWQGMGALIYEAVRLRDYPLLSGCLVMASVCVVPVNAAADILYSLIDPRVKDGIAFV